MAKKKKHEDPKTVLPEKHPLERVPEDSEEVVISEEDLDKIPDEEEEESAPPDTPPVPGEGP
jgi:hypothetical protein